MAARLRGSRRISQAITALEGAREAYHASLRNWNNLVALHGEDSPEAMQFQCDTVYVTQQCEDDAVKAMLQIEPATPIELLRKIVAVRDGDPDYIHESEILLFDQAQRLLSAA